MTIIIKESNTSELSVAQEKFYEKHAFAICTIRQKISSLLSRFAVLNDLTRSSRYYPVENVCVQIAGLNKAILTLRILINELDSAAKEVKVSLPELQAFKETLDVAQEYYNETVSDFYALTSGADLEPQHPAPEKNSESEQEPVSEAGDGWLKDTLELVGQKISNLSDKEKMEALLKFSQLTTQILT